MNIHEFTNHIISSLDMKEAFDYLGISILGKQDFLFKIYYSQASSNNSGFILNDILYKHNMLSYYEQVSSFTASSYRRIDCKIKNRTDTNFQNLFIHLSNVFPLFNENQNTVKKLASLPITEQDRYMFSSLYFISSLESDKDIKELKLHFYTKKVIDPEHFSKGGIYDDNYFLSYLENLKIYGFESLIPKARFLISCLLIATKILFSASNLVFLLTKPCFMAQYVMYFWDVFWMI